MLHMLAGAAVLPAAVLLLLLVLSASVVCSQSTANTQLQLVCTSTALHPQVHTQQMTGACSVVWQLE
jgi:hypothetical protein